jgi:hypothetical protein
VVGKPPLDEGSAYCRDLYLTTHSTYKRQTFMPPAGFEPAVPTSERPENQTLNPAASESGVIIPKSNIIRFIFDIEIVW